MIIVIGDVMLDIYTYGTSTRRSPESDCVIVDYEREVSYPGGAANVAMSTRYFHPTALIGVVGDDDAGFKLKNMLSGVMDYLATVWGRQTTIKHRFLNEHGHFMRLDREICKEVDYSKLLDKFSLLVDKATTVILSDYGKGVITEKLCLSVIQECHSRRIPVIVDPKGTYWSKYEGATLICPNQKELAQAGGVEYCWSLGIKNILETRGADGMLLYTNSREPYIIKGLPIVEVNEVSGAGDVITAVMAARIADGWGYLAAAIEANKYAAQSIIEKGTCSIPNRGTKHASS